MIIKDSFQFQKEASLLQNHLSFFRRLLSSRAFKAQLNQDPYPESEYLNSRVELSESSQIPYGTLRHWEKAGLIKPIRHGLALSYHKPVVLETLAHNEKIAAYFVRKQVQTASGKTKPKIRKEPLAVIESQQIEDGWLFIVFRYSGLRYCICCSPKLQGKEARINAFINTIIKIQNNLKSSKVNQL